MASAISTSSSLQYTHQRSTFNSQLHHSFHRRNPQTASDITLPTCCHEPPMWLTSKSPIKIKCLRLLKTSLVWISAEITRLKICNWVWECSFLASLEVCTCSDWPVLSACTNVIMCCDVIIKICHRPLSHWTFHTMIPTTRPIGVNSRPQKPGNPNEGWTS